MDFIWNCLTKLTSETLTSSYSADQKFTCVFVVDKMINFYIYRFKWSYMYNTVYIFLVLHVQSTCTTLYTFFLCYMYSLHVQHCIYISCVTCSVYMYNTVYIFLVLHVQHCIHFSCVTCSLHVQHCIHFSCVTCTVYMYNTVYIFLVLHVQYVCTIVPYM
jgi:hypothetical protein